MARPSRFQQIKSDIVNFFDKQDTRIFTPRNMTDIFYQGKLYWKFPESLTFK